MRTQSVTGDLAWEVYRQIALFQINGTAFAWNYDSGTTTTKTITVGFAEDYFLRVFSPGPVSSQGKSYQLTVSSPAGVVVP